MTGFQKTYQIARGPAAETFDAYAAKVSVDYAALLNADPDETIVQHFLEANPCLVPGMRSLDVLPSTFPNHALLISQPMLPGLSSKVPDFLWIAYNSVGIYPTFIEIERPGKVIFNADGSPSAKFTQASHQLVQWKAGWRSRATTSCSKGNTGCRMHRLVAASSTLASFSSTGDAPNFMRSRTSRVNELCSSTIRRTSSRRTTVWCQTACSRTLSL
jgi:hypothetical protein